MKKPECPKCGGADVHVARRRRYDKFITLFYWRRPYRCEDCLKRFYGPDTKLFTFGRSVAASIVAFFALVTGVTLYEEGQTAPSEISFFEENVSQFGGLDDANASTSSKAVPSAAATVPIQPVTSKSLNDESSGTSSAAADAEVEVAATKPAQKQVASITQNSTTSAIKPIRETGKSTTQSQKLTDAEKEAEEELDESIAESAIAAVTRSEENRKRNNEKEIVSLVNSWAADWGSQNVDAYLANYSKSFRTDGGITVGQWAASRRQRVSAPAYIDLEIRDVQPTLHSLTIASVTFVQNYKSNTYTGTARKRLWYWKSDDRWLIVKEEVIEDI